MTRQPTPGPAPHDRPNTVPWPPLILISGIVIGFLLHALVPLPWPPSPLGDMLFALGILLIAGALFIDFSAMRAMNRARTTIMPHKASEHLVVEGPFKWSRNPIYVANVMIVSGLGFVFGSLWHILMAALVGILINVLAIPGEERHLEHRFGKPYRDYVKKVRRWI